MSEQGEAMEMAEDALDDLRRENTELRERLRVAEQTRDAAQEASTKAVMERREAYLDGDMFEEEVKRLRRLIATHGTMQATAARLTKRLREVKRKMRGKMRRRTLRLIVAATLREWK